MEMIMKIATKTSILLRESREGRWNSREKAFIDTWIWQIMDMVKKTGLKPAAAGLHQIARDVMATYAVHHIPPRLHDLWRFMQNNNYTEEFIWRDTSAARGSHAASSPAVPPPVTTASNLGIFPSHGATEQPEFGDGSQAASASGSTTNADGTAYGRDAADDDGSIMTDLFPSVVRPHRIGQVTPLGAPRQSRRLLKLEPRKVYTSAAPELRYHPRLAARSWFQRHKQSVPRRDKRRILAARGRRRG